MNLAISLLEVSHGIRRQLQHSSGIRHISVRELKQKVYKLCINSIIYSTAAVECQEKYL